MSINAKEFLFSLPEKIAPGALDGLSTRFHFVIADSGEYTVVVDAGKMDVSDGLNGDAICKVQASEATLAKIIGGDLSPTTAVFTGKLKISNLSEMMKYAKIFGLM